MAEEQQSVNIASESKATYADNTAIALRIKAAKNSKGEVEKEGELEIIFLDMLTHQAVGRFVLGRLAAKDLLNGLSVNLTNMEKELASKSIPKPPEIKPTNNTTYR
jgi:hypothetical protein